MNLYVAPHPPRAIDIAINILISFSLCIRTRVPLRYVLETELLGCRK